jgi:hypothetical protein
VICVLYPARGIGIGACGAGGRVHVVMFVEPVSRVSKDGAGFKLRLRYDFECLGPGIFNFCGLLYHSSVAALYSLHSLTLARPKGQAQDQDYLWKMKTHRNEHTGNARPYAICKLLTSSFKAALPLQSVASQ